MYREIIDWSQGTVFSTAQAELYYRYHMKENYKMKAEEPIWTRTIENLSPGSAEYKLWTLEYFSHPNNIPDEIASEIHIKNWLRRDWQCTWDPNIKRELNHKIKFIRNILKTRRQDSLIEALDSNSLYKLNKYLLNTKPAVH